MNIVNQCLSLDQFKDYVTKYNFGRLKPSKIVVHHTWRPTVEQWQGQKSINGLKTFYEGKGWRSGPHLFVADDGIWLFTPMDTMGTHAGVGNSNSIGIEVVGDYDVEKWAGKTKDNALGVIKALMTQLNLNTEAVKFHNDYSTKSCPGHSITKEWLFRELNFYGQVDEIPEWANVAGAMSAKDVWEKAKALGIASKDTKFNDPIPMTVGKMMIFLARLFPDKFK